MKKIMEKIEVEAEKKGMSINEFILFLLNEYG